MSLARPPELILRTRRYDRGAWRAYLMLVPSAVFLAGFTLWPMLRAIYTSLMLSDNAHPTPQFGGFANFSALFHNPVFWQVMGNTALFIVCTVPITLILAMVFSVMLNGDYKLMSFFRISLFHPIVLPLVSAASIWLFLYTPNFGLVDEFLSVFGGSQLNWLGEPRLAIWAIIIMTIWKQLGYFTIFYLAGLQNVGKEPYEAADVDGAGAWTQFWKITVPLQMPTTMFVFIIAMVNAFQMVDQLYVMTQGGPNNGTNMLLYYIYQQAFTYQNNGIASAATVILIIILVLLAVLQTWVDRRVHYQS